MHPLANVSAHSAASVQGHTGSGITRQVRHGGTGRGTRFSNRERDACLFFACLDERSRRKDEMSPTSFPARKRRSPP